MKNRNILVVDDEKVLRELAVNLFEHLGYFCASAESGEKALEYLKNHENNLPNLVLSDIDMKNGDGLDLTEKCKQLYPNLPFLMVTGNTYSYQSKLLDRGLPYLAKPYNLLQLKEKVEEIIKMADE